MKPTIAFVQNFVAARYQIPREMMKAQCRMPRYAKPRQIAMAVAMELGHQQSFVARAFDRDHATIHHAQKRFGNSIELHRMVARILIRPDERHFT
jgi:chromosomal replication initiator protein